MKEFDGEELTRVADLAAGLSGAVGLKMGAVFEIGAAPSHTHKRTRALSNARAALWLP